MFLHLSPHILTDPKMLSEVSAEQLEANHIALGIFIGLIVITDLLVLYCLSALSLRGPKSSLSDAANLNVQPKLCDCFKLRRGGSLIPDYFFSVKYPIGSFKDNHDGHCTLEANQWGLRWSHICDRIFRKRRCTDYAILCLQIWSFICGALSFYLSLVFWMNMFLEFIINCVGRGWTVNLLALSSVYFIMEIMLWFLRRQCEGIIVLTRNTADSFNVRMVAIYWRLFDILLVIACSIPTHVDLSSSYFEIFVMFMVLRGFLWQCTYILITFISTVVVTVKNLNHKKCEIKSKIYQFLFVVHRNDNVDITDRVEETPRCCSDRVKVQGVVILWLMVVIDSILAAVLGLVDCVGSF